MKKFFYFICLCLFTLKSVDIYTDFVSFYEKYFNEVLEYKEFSEAEKRFAFIFHYFEARNIGDLRFGENNFIDREKDKFLTEDEIGNIKDFFIKTTDQLSFFDKYKAGYSGSKKPVLNMNDPIWKSFNALRSDLLELPKIEDMHATMADMTFVVKSNYDHETIFKNAFSDAHSSPEYFGKGFKKNDRNINENQDKSLEEQYESYLQSMSPAVSFFGGDLDDRDMFDFLDSEIDSKKYYERINFLRYNFFKDFHHTVHAAWQIYCLCHNQPDLIGRWQVFGNHETETINQEKDKKNTCAYFVHMMSQIRQSILPTEIDFINEDEKEIISLSHAFGARHGLTATHDSKAINENFNIMYLKSKPEYQEENLTIEGAYGHHIEKNFIISQAKGKFKASPDSFENLKEPIYQSQNPQLWTDYRPDLHDLLSKIDTKFCYEKGPEGRGYNVKGNINEVLEWRKKIVLHNFELCGLGKKYCDFPYFHISGHTHGGEDTTKLVFESQKNVFSFSNLRHFAKNSEWLFTACSCHNKYGTELADFVTKRGVFDCSKPEEPISVFETVDNYEQFYTMLHEEILINSISPFFIKYLKEAAGLRKKREEGYNNEAKKVDELNKKITFFSNFLTPQLGYFGIPGVGFFIGSKFKQYKNEMHLISGVLSGVKLIYFLMKAHKKTTENKRAFFACQNQRDSFSKSLEKNKFMDDKRKVLLNKMIPE